MSQDGTYKTPEKIAIDKGICVTNLAGSRVIAQNEGGTSQLDWHKSDTSGSASVHAANENPGALAGATGARDFTTGIVSTEYRKRAEAATALCLAIGNCNPQDACEIMAAALGDLGAGTPQPPLFSIMEAATDWADWASVAELKAYCLACFRRLCLSDRSAFLAFVGRVG